MDPARYLLRWLAGIYLIAVGCWRPECCRSQMATHISSAVVETWGRNAVGPISRSKLRINVPLPLPLDSLAFLEQHRSSHATSRTSERLA
ncbi:hypothetical protein GGR56DRAFT_633147 [Xylariaceae sp. FL0804]|nr:hypothetical protein GGR56DRAFT_633147 [Xylariaceae sp. FL0804]